MFANQTNSSCAVWKNVQTVTHHRRNNPDWCDANPNRTTPQESATHAGANHATESQSTFSAHQTARLTPVQAAPHTKPTHACRATDSSHERPRTTDNRYSSKPTWTLKTHRDARNPSASEYDPTHSASADTACSAASYPTNQRYRVKRARARGRFYRNWSKKCRWTRVEDSYGPHHDRQYCHTMRSESNNYWRNCQ